MAIIIAYQSFYDMRMRAKIPSYQQVRLLKFNHFNWPLIKKAWHTMSIDYGKTYKKSIVDPKTRITFLCLFNQKRMARRGIKIDLRKNCPLCDTQQLSSLKIGEVGAWDLICNKYPIVPYHLILNSKTHRTGPSLHEALTMVLLSKYIPQERILLSPGLGTGAGIPLHVHAHLLPLRLSLEDAKVKKFYTFRNITLNKLIYPAWGLKIMGPSKILGRIIFQLIRSSKWPLNLSFVNGDVFVIPRKEEMPEICKGIVDGVGTLATSGLYTLCDREALKRVTLKTFIEGLRHASFAEDNKFQTQFIELLIPLIEEKGEKRKNHQLQNGF